MGTEAQNLASTALQTSLAVAQALATTDPKIAAAMALAPLVAELLNEVEAMQRAGSLTPEALADLFASIGQSVRSTHDQWAAMNAADAAAAT
jgi:hypothetical protein